jgi:hypothetical protein
MTRNWSNEMRQLMFPVLHQLEEKAIRSPSR